MRGNMSDCIYEGNLLDYWDTISCYAPKGIRRYCKSMCCPRACAGLFFIVRDERYNKGEVVT